MIRRRSFGGPSAARLAAVGGVMCVLGAACPARNAGTPGNASDDLAQRGRVLYTTAHATAGGERISCADCHGAEGDGGSAPELRDEFADHLRSHAQAGGAHPEGIKYPHLSREDFEAMAVFLGGGAGDDHPDNDHDDDLVGDAARGELVFNAPHETSGAGLFSCGNCHAPDGSSGFGPDLRGEPADHLAAHAQGSGRHPAGVKYPTLSAQDFADMAAFLSGESDHHDSTDHEAHKATARPNQR